MDAATPELTVLYFAWLRERVGTGEETLSLPAGVRTVGDLIAWLVERSPRHAAAFAESSVRSAAR